MNSQLIGGMFGLVEPSKINNQFPPFLKNDKELFLANARSGINILAGLLKPRKIWMPSFLCDAMLKAVKNLDMHFYEVDSHLHISRSWVNTVESGELVVLIDYFGFPFDSSLAEDIKEHGGWVLEDASQALLSSNERKLSDFVLFSPRKFLGVPDGGILRNYTSIDLSEIQLKHPPSGWWLRTLNATILRRDFDLYGGERSWFKLFQETEADSPVGPYAMSMLSKTLLEHSFDYSSIIQKRIENYQILDDHLNKFALFPKLPIGVVPLGYPIQLNNRDHVRQILFDNNIYPPVHWPITDIVPKKFVESHRLADTILTLVCDQRYNPTEMERIARIVLQETQNGRTAKTIPKKPT